MGAVVGPIATIAATTTGVIDEYIIDSETGGHHFIKYIIGEIVSSVEYLLVQVGTISFKAGVIVEKIRLDALDTSI